MMMSFKVNAFFQTARKAYYDAARKYGEDNYITDVDYDPQCYDSRHMNV